jgi:hypothetical protein
MATMQLENFHKIIQKQLDNLIEVMDKLPSGSVKSKYEDLIKPWSPKPDTPYLRILVNKSGEVLTNDTITNLDSLKEALRKLAQNGGLILYTREVVDGVEAPTVAEDIMRIIADNRLPVRLCKETDFSDAINENGKLRLN